MANEPKGLARHKKMLQATDKKVVETGWFSGNKYPSKENADGTKSEPVEVWQAAKWNEFGTGKIPARPFMRLANRKLQPEFKNIEPKIFSKVLKGELTTEQGLGLIGLKMEEFIVDSIKNGGWTPNSDITINGTTPDKNGNQFIKGKGFDKPLIDTSLMWQSVSSKVS